MNRDQKCYINGDSSVDKSVTVNTLERHETGVSSVRRGVTGRDHLIHTFNSTPLPTLIGYPLYDMRGTRLGIESKEKEKNFL